MDVTEIVKTWLSENGYDGLVDPDRECGCRLADLMPCGEGWEKCEAGHMKVADPKTGYDFFIYPGKAQQQDSLDEEVYCHKCSVAGDAGKPIYHKPPVCK